MGSKSSGRKSGVKSSSIKQSTSRYGTGESPRTRAVAGAFSKEGLDRDTQGKLRTPSAPGPKETRRPLARRRSA